MEKLLKHAIVFRSKIFMFVCFVAFAVPTMALHVHITYLSVIWKSIQTQTLNNTAWQQQQQKSEWKQYPQTGNLNDLNKTSVRERKNCRNETFFAYASIHWRANSLGLSLSTHLQNHFICHRKSLIWDCFMLCTRGKMLSTRVCWFFWLFYTTSFYHSNFRFSSSRGCFLFIATIIYALKSRVERLNFRYFFDFVSFSWFNFCDPLDDCVTLKLISLYSSFVLSSDLPSHK